MIYCAEPHFSQGKSWLPNIKPLTRNVRIGTRKWCARAHEISK